MEDINPVQVFSYDDAHERDQKTKQGGILVGEARDPFELKALVDKAPWGVSLCYFVGDIVLGYGASMEHLGAIYDEMEEGWVYMGKYL